MRPVLAQDYPKKDEKRNQAIDAAVNTVATKRPSLFRYVPCLEVTMGQKKHYGLDNLLSALREKTYEQIAKDFPNLVKPIEDFTETRSLMPGRPDPETRR